MDERTFVVTLETIIPFEECLPDVTSKRMAEIVRNAMQSGSCVWPVPLPFEVTVKGEEERASTSGQTRVCPRNAFEEGEEAAMWGE